MSMQLDMFDPIHITLRREAEHQNSLAMPYLARSRELEKQAVFHCPHDTLEWEYIYHDDDYGRSLEQSTEVKVWCVFCKASHTIYRRDLKDNMTDRDIFSMKKEK